jgi:outer membrane protein assembly factor BamB
MKAALWLVASAVAATASAGDWPQWLGPTRDGQAASGALPSVAAPKLSVAWRRPLGPGLSGIVSGNGHAFTLFSDGESDYAVALALADGREAWRTKLDPSPPGSDRGPGSTPLVEGRELIVQAGGRDNETSLVGLDPATGATLWSLKGAHRTTYSSPVVAEVGGVRQLVVHTTLPGPPPRSGLLGLKLDDRSVLWSTALEKGVSFETPLVTPDGRVVLLTWSDVQTVTVTRNEGRFEATPSWQSGDLVSYVSPPVLVGNHLYGFGGDFLACVDPKTGRTLWKEKLYPGSVSAAGSHLAVLSVNAGALRLVEAGPGGYREKAKIDLFARGSRAEAPPTVIAGHVLARNDEEIVAVRVE